MRLAVISDIHANLTALTAVAGDIDAAAPDLIVCAGDLVGSGARPAEVIDFVRGRGWPTAIGNTDEVLWNPQPLSTLAARLPAMKTMWDLVMDDVAQTKAAVGPARVDWLRTLPETWSAGDVTVLHARPGDCWNAPSASATDEELESTYAGLRALVVHGHTHVPFVRKIGRRTIANSGSVGLPYDKDPRASYLLVTNGVSEIRRVSYDVDAEAAALAASGSRAAKWVEAIMRRGEFTPPT